VSNAGGIYCVDCKTFARTRRADGPATYSKVVPAGAERVGRSPTKEGLRHYPGGFLARFNDTEGREGYTMLDLEKLLRKARRFELARKILERARDSSEVVGNGALRLVAAQKLARNIAA
jgi:hypothetical protein